MTVSVFARGNQFLRQGKLEEAIASYEKAIGLNPQFAWSYQNLGDALEKVGRRDEAIAIFRRAVANCPESPWCFYKLGMILGQQGEFQEGVGYLRRAIDLKKDMPEFYLGLGSGLVKLGQWSQGVDCINRALGMWGGRVGKLYRMHLQGEADFYLAEAKSGQEQWLEAAEFYGRSWEVNPGRVDCCMGWARALGKLGRWSEAVELYRQGVVLFEESSEIWFGLGQALGQLGRWEEAVVEYGRVLEVNPKSAVVRHQLGYALMRLGRSDEGESELRKAMELDPGSVAVRQQSGDVLRELRKRDEAVELKCWAESKFFGIPHEFPSDMTLPPIFENNDYTFIEEKVKDFVDKNTEYTLSVSIIVLVNHNSEEFVLKTLAALTHQTYPHKLIEVILVNSQKSFSTKVDKYKSYFNLALLDNPRKDAIGGSAYNQAFKKINSDCFITLGYGTIPCPSMVEEFMKILHVTSQAVIVGGNCFVDTKELTEAEIIANVDLVSLLSNFVTNTDIRERTNDKKILESQVNIIQQTELLKKERYPFRVFLSFNAAYPRMLLEKVGLFDEDFEHCGFQDKEFGYRIYNAGYYFIPALNALGFHQECIINRSSRKNSPGKHYSSQKIFEQKCPVAWYRRYKPLEIYKVPKVSIYIPSYNNGKFIKEAVDSALNQTYSDLEVCICDDGSNDNTLQVLEENYANHPKVRWVTQENGGIGKASNTAVRMCRGMYIGQLDSDDVLQPKAVEILVDYLDNNSVGCVYSSCARIDAQGNYVKDEYNWRVFSREKMLMTSIVHHFRMFRKKDWMRTEGFNEKLLNAVDYDMFLKLSEVCSFYHINQKLYLRRIHGKNTSVVNEKQQTDNTLTVITYSLERMKLADTWEVYSPDPANPRKVAFRKKKKAQIFFYPDYRKSNTYQHLLYSHLPGRYFCSPGKIEDALQTLKDTADTVIFHLHWTQHILVRAKSPMEAEVWKSKYLQKIFEFISLGGSLIWTIHNALPHNCKYIKQEVSLRNVLVEAANKIHIHSKASILEIQKHINLPLDKVQISPHGNYVGVYPNKVDRATARKHFGFSPEETVFLFLGQIRYYKGIDILMEAFAKVNQIYPKTSLVIAGKPLDPIDKSVLNFYPDVLNSILLVERYIPGEELQLYFNCADIVVLPYRKILTSGSVILALSFGRPVIAPRCGMIEEVIQDGCNGFTYEPERIDLLTQVMSQVVNLKSEDKEKLNKQSLHSVLDLSWDKIAKDFYP